MTSDIGTQHTIAAVNARTRLEGHGVPEAWSWLPHISHIACPKKSKNTGKHDMGNIYNIYIYIEFIEWIPQCNNGDTVGIEWGYKQH